MAKIMQRMVESPAYALTQESRQILAHEITHLATGREHAAMLPDAGTRFYTAKQVGDDTGVSNRRVMKTAREMGLVAPEGSANEYGRWKMSKSAHGPHELYAPIFKASTAVSTVPYAVTKITPIAGSYSLIHFNNCRRRRGPRRSR